MSFRVFLRETGVIVATTLGAGMFALPYIFLKAGWLAGVFYLLFFAIVLSAVHNLYWRTLSAVNEKERLLGLVHNRLGKKWSAPALIAIVGGLFMALVVYLILGTQFLHILFPGAPRAWGLLIFWLISVLPLISERRVLGFELLGFFLMAAIIALIFFFGPGGNLPRLAAVDPKEIFLPFGAVLFSLAAWTAVEPLHSERKLSGLSTKSFWRSSFWGTFFSAALYFIFALGIYLSAPRISEDTISGLSGWPFWKIGAVSALGLFALWTSYMPIGLEIRNAFEKDLGWGKRRSALLVVFLPLILVFAGLNSFLSATAIAGGVFLALQYLFIIAVGRKVLRPRGAGSFFWNLLMIVFALGAVYEVYYFIVK